MRLFLEYWGYGAICAVGILGNAGVPVPEEAVLTLSGYLVWRGELEWWLVLVVGIVSASVGEAVGYWLGRRFGSQMVRHYGSRLWITPATLDATERFMQKYGALAVVSARFLPGLRFAAGPFAGITGIPAAVFGIANVLGACLYVPVMVAIGYGVGQSAGSRLERLRTPLVSVEHVVLAAVVLLTLLALLRRARLRSRIVGPNRPVH